MTEFSVSCCNCSGEGPLFQASCPDGLDEKKWRAAWKATATGGADGGPQYRRIKCKHCGCHFQLVDDGIPLEEGGGVKARNVSMPRIDSLSISGGSRTGGTAVTIHGMALDIGTLVVRVGASSALINERTSTSATILTPPGNYSLNVAEGPLIRLVIGSVSGSFTAGEGFIIGGGLATGAVRKSEGNTLTAVINATTVTLASLEGELLVGGTSGANGTVISAQIIYFQTGEQVSGAVSGASGVLLDASTFVIDRPTGGFTPNELVIGESSGAIVKLASSPAYSGNVDVIVENENGRRDVGGKLVAGFTYA